MKEVDGKHEDGGDRGVWDKFDFLFKIKIGVNKIMTHGEREREKRGMIKLFF